MKDRILIVDSEAGAVEVVRQYLMEEGFDCCDCSNPSTALECLRQDGPFSLLIAEIDLPEMNGVELLRRAKALDADLAFLVMTASMDVSSAIEAMHIGAHNFLLKPFHLSELAFNVDKALERRRLLLENRQYQLHLEERVHEATLELKRANDALRQTQEYLESLLDSSVDAVLILNTDWHVIYANRGAEGMLKYGAEELVGTSVSDLLPGGSEEVSALSSSLLDGPLRNHEMRIIARDRRELPIMASFSQVRDEEKGRYSTLAICKDITQQKKLEAELKEMTIKDGLTGLYNQRFFYQRLEHEMERARRQKHPLSLLLFDVDHFKTYNDQHGHLEGDKVLRVIGDVVRESTRDYVDTGFRYGGDEFTVILPEAGETQARLIAERIRASFEARHFDQCTLSVGLMTYSVTSTPEEFVHFADEMMYDAKRSGGNRVYVYNPKTKTMILERSTSVQ